MTIFYEGKLRIRPKVLYDRLKFRPGDLYSQQQQEKTQTGFCATEIISMSYNSKPNANAYLPYSVTTGITISVPNLSATRPIRS